MARELTPKFDKDVVLLFATRCVRLFAYGFLSIVLVIYLVMIGLSDLEIGLLLSLTLIGDTVISFVLTTRADRVGRRLSLMVGAGLMLLAGVAFVLTQDFVLLLIAAIIGVISPSGNEVGPFLSLEQSALSQILPATRRTRMFAWYNLMGNLSTATGALLGGLALQVLGGEDAASIEGFQAIIVAYALAGIVLLVMLRFVSSRVELPSHQRSGGRFGLTRSKRTVMGLSALFATDAFGGGFVVQSVMAYYFYVRFGADPGTIGAIFFGANVLAGASALMADRIAARIGLLRTMVFTHLPSNVLLILVPLMPDLWSAMIVLLARFSISQMDVPTRQAYVMTVVRPEERSAASGITGIARTIGQSAALLLVGLLLASEETLAWAFIIAGCVKIAYDLAIFTVFKRTHPLEDGVK